MITLLPTSIMQNRQDQGPAAGNESHLSVRIDRKDYPANGSALRVLQDLRFEVEHGEFVSLLGPSGCGKTTLLRLIAGLDTAFEGEIRLGGGVLKGPGPDRGIVFQESRLLPWFTVRQNVAFALPEGLPRHDRDQRVDHALQLVGLLQFAGTWPYQLSGGMEKRAAFARALVNLPSLLLLDEPFAALDTFAKYALQDEVARVHGEHRTTTVLVTHDVDEAVYLSDWVAMLTPSPATVCAVYPVPLPRPRVRTSGPFEQLRIALLEKVLAQR